MSVNKSQQWNASRKVAGSILSAGKVFHRGIFVEDHSRLNSALSNGESYVEVSFTIMTPAVHVRDVPELDTNKRPLQVSFAASHL